MRHVLTLLALVACGLAACGPSQRPACEQVRADMQRAADAAHAEKYDAFRLAYADAVPLFDPVRDALHDADADYPMAAASDTWMLYESVVGLQAARAAGDSASAAQHEGVVRERLPILNSTLASTAGECDAL